jgi:hypothetical protein
MIIAKVIGETKVSNKANAPLNNTINPNVIDSIIYTINATL